uniref:Secreted protein n=1 Tax=Rhabditophanes sp. KR3021 TaxID=114890 RepID=A0AC35TT93_9BILA
MQFLSLQFACIMSLVLVGILVIVSGQELFDGSKVRLTSSSSSSSSSSESESKEDSNAIESIEIEEEGSGSYEELDNAKITTLTPVLTTQQLLLQDDVLFLRFQIMKEKFRNSITWD